MPELDPTLRDLADAYDIATEYWDWQGRHVTVAAETVVAVLAGLGVDAGSPESATAALAARREAPWARLLPAFVAVREGAHWVVNAHPEHGRPLDIWLELESGERQTVSQLENWNPPREVAGRQVGEASFELPTDLPLGYHTLHARSDERTAACAVVVTPRWLGYPERMGARRAWGVATQLYSVRSRQSWGVGDLVDLADLSVWSATEHGADFVLVNPLHAAEPVPPLEPSPYLPTSRRFANPLYLRVERVPEYADAPDDVRAEVARLAEPLVGGQGAGDPIDRNAAWSSKRAALQALFAVPRTPGRQLAFAGYRHREGQGLQDFATWSVIAAEHGATVDGWPDELRHPSSPAVREYAERHEDAVAFECWLQFLTDEQLTAAQQAGLAAGMSLGIMHDLAVGVHPFGADAWSLQDDYARGVSVGAPPDPYNQNGQDWSQPPWRPDRLAETGYAPYRAMVSTILRHAGGIRVDHVIGLFRLWWIPQGLGPTLGTYVRYDPEAMIGILALEAHRAEALVVGEDLGTVEPWVRDLLRERGILGTSILWFEGDFDADGGPLPAERWRELCLASVTTHDLPPTAAYLAGDHVRLRDRLGVLTRPVEEELAHDAAERQAWLDMLRRYGLLADDAGETATIEALHRYLTLTPSRLLCVSLTDLVGDRQAQNQPGTTDEYPNWRVPLTGPDGEPLLLEDVLAGDRPAALAAVLHPSAP